MIVRALVILTAMTCAQAPARGSTLDAEASGATGTPPLAERVDQFVRRVPIHGVPYHEARALGPEALVHLERVLLDPRRESDWASVCSTIGYIGSPRGFAILHRFVMQRSNEELSLDGVSTLTVALQASGFCASGAPGARKFFEAAVDPSFWRNAVPAYPGFSRNQMADLLASNVVIGLGFVQERWVEPLLHKAKSSKEGPRVRAAAAASQGAAEEIKRRGLENYMRWIQAQLHGERAK